MSMNKKLKYHHNDAKEQISLQIGSDEYREYLFDKSKIDELFHDYLKEDKITEDEANFEKEHEELEKHNEDIALDRMAKHNAGAIFDTAKRKYQNQMRKWDKVPDITKSARIQAEKTETLEDDKRVGEVKKRAVPELVYDDQVSDDEFIMESLNRYL